MSPDEAIQAAEDIAAEARYRHLSAREAYEAGRQDGYQQAKAEEEARWRLAAGLTVADGPGHAELEELRWGPDGREHFADPRPGDYPGQAHTRPQAQPETEPEMEAAP
jgi:hypothetical protein